MSPEQKVRAQRKRQGPLKTEWQMQKMQIESERRQEIDEQMRHLEEQKTPELMKLEIDTDKKDELIPENQMYQSDSKDFLSNINSIGIKSHSGRKLNQTKGDNQQSARDVATSSQVKNSKNWLVQKCHKAVHGEKAFLAVQLLGTFREQ